MKKLLKSLMLFAAAAMALTSCENEAMNEGIEANETYTMTFEAGAPQSRTSVSIEGEQANFSWTAGDKVAFIQSAVGAVGCNKTGGTGSISNGKATFTTTFDKVTGATSYNYGAYYPNVDCNSDKTFDNVVIEFPASQTLTAGSFDPHADMMMSKPILNKASNEHGGLLEFTRLAAIGKMNLKGLEAGETIMSVKLTLDTGVVLNGDVTLNFEDVTATYATKGNNYVEVKGSLAATANETEIFFTCFPGEYSGAYTIDVETDKAYYQTSGTLSNPLVFTAGNVLGFTASVEQTEAKNSYVYTKITNGYLADYSGRYLLVYEGGKLALNGSLTSLDAVGNSTTITSIASGKIEGDYSKYEFTIAKGADGNGYTVQSASGYYIGNDGTSNGLSSSKSTKYVNTINSSVRLVGKGGLLLQYYNSGDNSRFRYYGTSQEAVVLYRLDGSGSDVEMTKLATPTNVNATVDGTTVTVSWDAVANAQSYTVVCGSQSKTVTDANTVTFTEVANGTHNITVVANASSYISSDKGTATATVTEGSAAKAWTLVTDASTLAVGDKIIIAAKGSNYAMSTTQNSNNRGQTAITKSGNTASWTGSSVQEITLEAGTKTGTWAFKVDSQYLYAASSSKNYLRSGTKNDNAAWKVTITSAGVATVKAQGSFTRNWIQYNGSSSIFSCYSSAQADICIYKLQ